jgi:DNA-directed RNA polymerase specialized sigma24 family protein
MTCIISAPQKGPISALDNMKSTLNTPQSVLDRLHRLTPREREICVLHFIEGRSQILIAEWLDIAERVVRRHITHAVAKVPELEPLRVKSLEEIKRPKIFHLSQLKATERGPFNADEI